MESAETTPHDAPIEARPPLEGPVDAATGEPAPPDLRIRHTTHRFKVEATTEERDEAVAAMLETLDKIEAVRAQRKAEMAARKAEEEELLETLVEQRAKLRDGGTWTDVPCEERSNFATCTVEVVRLDTAEIVSSRAMTAEERQQSLFGDDTAALANANNGKGAEHADGIEGSSVVNSTENGHPPADDPGWEASQREERDEPAEAESPKASSKPKRKRTNGAAH